MTQGRVRKLLIKQQNKNTSTRQAMLLFVSLRQK
jgi:hypothetical protein